MAAGPSGSHGKSAGPVVKGKIDGLIAKGKADPAAVRTLRRRTTLWSPDANTLHNRVHLDVTLA